MSQIHFQSMTFPGTGKATRNTPGFRAPESIDAGEIAARGYLGGGNAVPFNTKVNIDVTFDHPDGGTWTRERIEARKSEGEPKFTATLNGGAEFDVDTAPMDDPSTPDHNEALAGTEKSRSSLGFGERVAMGQAGTWVFYCRFRNAELVSPALRVDAA